MTGKSHNKEIPGLLDKSFGTNLEKWILAEYCWECLMSRGGGYRVSFFQARLAINKTEHGACNQAGHPSLALLRMKMWGYSGTICAQWRKVGDPPPAWQDWHIPGCFSFAWSPQHQQPALNITHCFRLFFVAHFLGLKILLTSLGGRRDKKKSPKI